MYHNTTHFSIKDSVILSIGREIFRVINKYLKLTLHICTDYLNKVEYCPNTSCWNFTQIFISDKQLKFEYCFLWLDISNSSTVIFLGQGIQPHSCRKRRRKRRRVCCHSLFNFLPSFQPKNVDGLSCSMPIYYFLFLWGFTAFWTSHFLSYLSGQST